MGNVVAIEINATICRAIEYDCDSGTFGRTFEQSVNTTEPMQGTGRIDDAAVKRIIDALNEVDALYDLRTAHYHAVSTALISTASNSAEVFADIEAQTGVRFESIDEEREALFALTAVRARLEALEKPTDSLCMVNIGSESCTVTFYRFGEHVSKSFPVGIATVARQCQEVGEMRTFVQQAILREVYIFVDTFIITQGGRPINFVLSGEAPTVISALLQGMTYDDYDAHEINGYGMARASCERALKKMQAMDNMSRALYIGTGRETLMMAAVVLVEMFFDVLDYSQANVIVDGAREGVAIEYCTQL